MTQTKERERNQGVSRGEVLSRWSRGWRRGRNEPDDLKIWAFQGELDKKVCRPESMQTTSRHLWAAFFFFFFFRQRHFSHQFGMLLLRAASHCVTLTNIKGGKKILFLHISVLDPPHVASHFRVQRSDVLLQRSASPNSRCWWEVGWSFRVNKTFLELHGKKTVLQHSPSLVLKMNKTSERNTSGEEPASPSSSAATVKISS